MVLYSRVKSLGLGAREWMGCEVMSHKAKGTPVVKWKIVTSYLLS